MILIRRRRRTGSNDPDDNVVRSLKSCCGLCMRTDINDVDISRPRTGKNMRRWASPEAKLRVSFERNKSATCMSHARMTMLIVSKCCGSATVAKAWETLDFLNASFFDGQLAAACSVSAAMPQFARLRSSNMLMLTQCATAFHG